MKKTLFFLINLILIISALGVTALGVTAFADDTVYRAPEEIRGVLVTPGEDFATEQGQAEDKVKEQIDNIISTVADYGLNTIYLNLQHRNGTIYISDYYPVYTSFDVLQYFTEQCRQNDIYLYAVVNPAMIAAGDILYNYGYIYSDIIIQSQKNINEIVSNYDIDAILIEGYYNSVAENSFEEYKKHSAGMGFDQWMKESATGLVKTLSDTVKKADPSVQFGLVCDSVWANSSSLEGGSPTSADFEMRSDAYVDLPAIMECADINTLLIDLPGSLPDNNIPFKNTLQWWQNFASAYGSDVCALIYNNKLSSTEKGWTSPDQVLQQLIAVRDVKAKGAVFCNYKHISDNKDGHSDLVKKYFKGQVSTTDILTTLTVSRPEQRTYSTYEPNVSFYGASDPNFPLLLNGEEVERNANGVFSIEYELSAGENVFEFTHKTKSVTYNITRNVKIFQSVAPEGALTVEGDSVVTISAYAYKGSSITAHIDGLSIPLIETERQDDSTDKNSAYVLYVGDYQVPASTSSTQKLGNISFSGEWQGIKQSVTGASIKVTALPPDPIIVGEKGNMIEVTASQARTYPASVLNADPSGDSFPLPEGSRDFIASDMLTFTSGSTTNNYYILRSGVRINAADVKVIGEQEVVANNITEASVYSDGGYIYLKLKQDQPMAYKAELSGLALDPNNGIGSFTSNSITFTFNNVENVPDSVSVSDNNVFSSASVSKNSTDATITLYFHSAGRFAGYRSFYSDGYLYFRFTNTPSSLVGAKIYLDPGHGGYDSGALPIEGMKTEAQINREIAQKVADILQSKGANVKITDTTNYVSLSTRVQMSQDYSPHLFVSLHQNSSTSPSATGTEVWYFNPYSEVFADRISAEVASALDIRDRGEKYGWYTVTTHMEFPAVLVEHGFLSNVAEYDKLKDDSYQNAISQAIVSAIESAFKAK